MNAQQLNRANMLEAVIAYLDAHTADIADSTGLAEAFTELKDLTEAIWAKDNEKAGSSKGKSTKKDLSEEALDAQAMKIARGLYLWGEKNKDTEITELADLTESRFRRIRDAEKVNVAKALSDAASGKDLAFAKVTAAEITKLVTLTADFKKNIAGLSSGASKRIAAGQSLQSMLDEAVLMTKDLVDKYIDQYKEENEEFYNGYKAARVIYAKGGKQKQPEPPVPVNP